MSSTTSRCPPGRAIVAVAAFCLFHSPQPDHVIAQIAEALSPGGLAVLVTKGLDSYREDQLVAAANLDMRADEHESLYTAHSGNLATLAAASLDVITTLDEARLHLRRPRPRCAAPLHQPQVRPRTRPVSDFTLVPYAAMPDVPRHVVEYMARLLAVQRRPDWLTKSLLRTQMWLPCYRTAAWEKSGRRSSPKGPVGPPQTNQVQRPELGKHLHL